MKKTTKTFIGGLVSGLLVGLAAGGFAVGIFVGTLFINYANTHTAYNTYAVPSLIQHK